MGPLAMVRLAVVAGSPLFSLPHGPSAWSDPAVTAAAQQLSKIDYLKQLAAKAAVLEPARGPSDADLQLFRDRIMARPDDLRRKLLGANVQRRRSLASDQRRALDMLDATPDLLGPLGELRYEPAHSRLVARFLKTAAEPILAPLLLRAFLMFVGAPQTAVEEDARSAVVESERWLPTGRIDISIALPKHLVFVEMKVDAEEGEDQLVRYSKALAAAKGNRDVLLVYLTRPGAEKSNSGVNHTHVTLDQLLLAWLPFAGPGTGSEEYLARYLKSLALLVGCAGAGRFDDWSITQQAAALELVESLA